MRSLRGFARLAVLLVVVPIIIYSRLWAFEDEDYHTTIFYLNNIEHTVTIGLSDSGNSEDDTDVLLKVTGEDTRNLSLSLPGRNIFPVVTVSPSKQRFTVSWFQYHSDDMQICHYDSETEVSRVLSLQNFKTAAPIQTVFYKGEPSFLIFLGNNGNNSDLFLYHLETGEVRNITNTNESEQEWHVYDEGRRLFIETETLSHSYRYRIKKWNLKVTCTKNFPVDRSHRTLSSSKAKLSINTIAAFGDSLTWGTIRMNPANPFDYYHPEQAYLTQMEELLDSNYGDVTTVNLGYPGDHTWQAIERLDEDMSDVDAKYCLVMLGTNDVARRIYDPDASIENLRYIVQRVKNHYGMSPIISAIPPQKDEERYAPHRQVHVLNTIVLNARIISLARELDIPYCNPHHDFFNSELYWEDYLETYRGNHPSPAGHRLIANRFMEAILSDPPSTPEEVEFSQSSSSTASFQWQPNKEFDFSHYNIQYGTTPDDLSETVSTSDTYYEFDRTQSPFPEATQIYFRIQAVDKDGNGGEYSQLFMLEFG